MSTSNTITLSISSNITGIASKNGKVSDRNHSAAKLLRSGDIQTTLQAAIDGRGIVGKTAKQALQGVALTLNDYLAMPDLNGRQCAGAVLAISQELGVVPATLFTDVFDRMAQMVALKQMGINAKILDCANVVTEKQQKQYSTINALCDAIGQQVTVWKAARQARIDAESAPVEQTTEQNLESV